MKGLELINIICPEHDRTSCSDECTDNGLDFLYKEFRCTRCALIDINNGMELPDGLKFDSMLQWNIEDL